jgi:hypothetical protein
VIALTPDLNFTLTPTFNPLKSLDFKETKKADSLLKIPFCQLA